MGAVPAVFQHRCETDGHLESGVFSDLTKLFRCDGDGLKMLCDKKCFKYLQDFNFYMN